MPQLTRQPQAQKFDLQGTIRAAAAKYRIPEALLAAVIQVESSNRQNVVSPKGAIGYGQLMPATAQALGVDPNDPVQNISGAAQLLSQLLTKYGGRKSLALAAYNAGETAVDRVKGVPNIPETLNYIRKVEAALTKGVPAGVTVAGAAAPARRTAAMPDSSRLPHVGDEIQQVAPLPLKPVGPSVGGGTGGGGGGGRDAAPPAAPPPGSPPGLGQISNQAMEQAMREIMAAQTGAQDVDMSRQFEELQPGPYGGPDPNAEMDALVQPQGGGPSLAPFYSGGTFPQPSGLGFLSKMFKPSGGRTFTDDVPSER